MLCLSFWMTIVFVRSFLFVASIMRGHDPRITIEYMRIHHYLFGIFLLVVVGISLALKVKKGFLQLIGMGVGTALVIDEFSFLWTFSAREYWNFTQGEYWGMMNFFAIVAMGIFFLAVVHLAPNEPKIKKRFVEPVMHLNPQNPFLSVVIPAFNEEKFLPKALQSLVRQNFLNFELIVIDNNSSDRTAEIAESFGARVVAESRQGVGFARQKGFESARGQIIAATDADASLPVNWLSTIVKEFQKDQKLVAFGGLYNLYSGSMFARFIIRYFVSIFWRIDKFMSGSWPLPGINFAVRKTAFLQIGGFNTALKIGEDVDLSLRLAKIGKVVLHPEFRVLESGRRFSQGLMRGLAAYAPSTLYRMLFRHHMPAQLPTVRKENVSSYRSVLLPVAFVVIFLFVLFSNANPEISQAKEVQPLVKHLQLMDFQK